MKLLLTKDGVDPDSRDNDGQTSLLCAAEKGREAVVKLLLNKGADANAQGGCYGNAFASGT
jgi:ankyrin repeat protein